MAYNKAREERKWRLWKEAEEKKLRTLGISEDAIEKLRVYDWDIFKSERRYYEKLQDVGTYLNEIAEEKSLTEIKTSEQFLDNIESEQLYRALVEMDKLSLRIIVMKVQGYSTHDIALDLGITEKAVYRRIDRLKERLKKFLN